MNLALVDLCKIKKAEVIYLNTLKDTSTITNSMKENFNKLKVSEEEVLKRY